MHVKQVWHVRFIAYTILSCCTRSEKLHHTSLASDFLHICFFCPYREVWLLLILHIQKDTYENRNTGNAMQCMLFLWEIVLTSPQCHIPCIKRDIPYYMGPSALFDTNFCYHAMLWLPRRVQRSAPVYVYNFGGKKTQCDSLIFN